MTSKEWSIAALSVLYKAGLAVQKDDHFIPTHDDEDAVFIFGHVLVRERVMFALQTQEAQDQALQGKIQ